MNIKFLAVFLLFLSTRLQAFEFTFDPIDVIIPCHEKDIRTLPLVIECIKKNIINHRRIIVISSKKLIDTAEWFDEKNYPFTKESLAYEIFHIETEAHDFINQSKTRIGWIYQQLLKTYALFVIPDISSNVLAIDADTIFLKPVSFQDPKTGAGLYSPALEPYQPYFDHNARVLPGLKKFFTEYSGVSHHMLFQRNLMEALHNEIESIHNKPAWKVFCEFIDKKYLFVSCMSIDYELYFNYIFSKTDLVKIRRLNWNNCKWQDFNRRKNDGYDFLSCHAYL